MYMYNVPICCHSRALNWPLKLIKIENIVLWCLFFMFIFLNQSFSSELYTGTNKFNLSCISLPSGN